MSSRKAVGHHLPEPEQFALDHRMCHESEKVQYFHFSHYAFMLSSKRVSL